MNKQAIAIHVSIALKGASKALRNRFASPDWQVAEQAGRELAALIAAGLGAFEITEKPMAVSVARSQDGQP